MSSLPDVLKEDILAVLLYVGPWANVPRLTETQEQLRSFITSNFTPEEIQILAQSIARHWLAVKDTENRFLYP
jgi:hypothetical protein